MQMICIGAIINQSGSYFGHMVRSCWGLFLCYFPAPGVKNPATKQFKDNTTGQNWLHWLQNRFLLCKQLQYLLVSIFLTHHCCIPKNHYFYYISIVLYYILAILYKISHLSSLKLCWSHTYITLSELWKYHCNKYSESSFRAQKCLFSGEKPYMCENVIFVIFQASSSLFGGMKPLH